MKKNTILKRVRRIFAMLLVIGLVLALTCGIAFASDGGSAPVSGIDWTRYMIAATGLLLTGVVIPLINAVFTWFKSKTRSEKLHTALEEAHEVATNVVATLQQTIVEDLKAKSTNGKLSIDDAKEIGQDAIRMFLSDLSEESRKFIESNADDFNAYVGRLIESRLFYLKAKKGT